MTFIHTGEAPHPVAWGKTKLVCFTMKVELKIKTASSVINMSNCSRQSETSCGIMYRYG